MLIPRPLPCTYPIFSYRGGLYLHHEFLLLGAPVSSLYGALSWKRFPRCSHVLKRFSLHRYPREFQSAISAESCMNLQGSVLPLNYSRKLLNLSKIFFFLLRNSPEKSLILPLYMKSYNFKAFFVLY